MDIELRHLDYFIAVAEEGSFNKGALRLHLSQPTLSRQLRDLECRLGVSLFCRSRAGLSLTEAGSAFLHHARAVLGEKDAMLQAMQKFGRRELRIGYMAASLFGAVGDAIAALRGLHPEITLQISEASPGAQLEMLRQAKLDVAFIGHVSRGLPPEALLHFLFEIPLHAVLSPNHRFAHRASLDLEELAGEPFVGLREDSFPGRQELLAVACSEAGFTVSFAELADSLVSLLTLVGHGQGVTLIPSDAASLAQPSVVFVPLKGRASIRFHAATRGPIAAETATLLDLCRR